MRIVALVGADGMGKTTQAQLLTEKLTAAGRDATHIQPLFVLFDPWEGNTESAMGKALSPRLRRAEVDRTQGSHLTLPRLARALAGTLYAIASYAAIRVRFRHWDVVVCDRYFYQYFYDLLGRPAKGVALSFPRPDMAFWLDGNVDLVRSRTADENLQGDWRPYYESLMRYYRDIAGPLQFVRVDAELPTPEVNDMIWKALAPAVGVTSA